MWPTTISAVFSQRSRRIKGTGIKGNSVTWHPLRAIWHGSRAGLYTIGPCRVGNGRELELLNEVEVLTDQRLGVARGLSNVVGVHAGVATQLHATQRLHVVFNLLGRVEGFLSDLAGRFFLHQAFVADDRFVTDGASHVVDGAATRDRQSGGFLLGA